MPRGTVEAKPRGKLQLATPAELFQSMLSNSNLKVTLNKKSSLSKHIQTILKQLSKDDDLEVRLESFDVIKLCGDLLGPDEIEDLILSIYKSLPKKRNLQDS